MDIENMKAFNKVAELKSISAAANELHHLQSNMSNKIKNIEKQFQTQLFFRHSNGVELTKEGEKIYQQFKKMILLWEETIDIINNEEETISIGITQSSLPMEFNTIIKKFYQQFPNKKLSIVSGSTSELIPKIANRELTIAYVAELEKENLFQDSQIISQTLSWDKLVFAGNTAGKSVQKILAEERLYVSANNVIHTVPWLLSLTILISQMFPYQRSIFLKHLLKSAIINLALELSLKASH